MTNYRSLTREEIIDSIDQLSGDAEFAPWRDFYLHQAVYSLDPEWAGAMLDLGANPNYLYAGYESFFHQLFEKFRLERTVKGEVVLSLVRLLLMHGADPNLVGCNNFRAVDLAMEAGYTKFANLLLAAGADPEPRPFV